MEKITKYLRIPCTDRQHDLFSRIAAADDRRLSELSILIFAEGLRFYWCEDSFSFKKRDDEFTAEEKDQQALNTKLEEDFKKEGKNLWDLSFDERKKLGYKPVDGWFRGGEYIERDAEALNDQLAEELKELCRREFLSEEDAIKEGALSDKYMIEGDDDAYKKHDHLKNDEEVLA